MKIQKLRQENFEEIIKKTSESIRKGNVVVVPTDTVYGLTCDATNKKAVDKIVKIKGRAEKKPLSKFIKSIKEARKFAKINKSQETFLKKVWPGKVTVVFIKKKGKRIHEVGKRTIGLRIPNYKLINILLEKLNRPLIGTSANISGKPASTKIEEVIRQFKNKRYRPDLLIDAGNLPKNKSSKVIDFTGEKIKIIRK